MKLSLRDLFWLVLIVGMGIAFIMDHSRQFGPYWECRQRPNLRLGLYRPSMQSVTRWKFLAILRYLSDDKLRELLAADGANRDFRSCCLTEAARRGLKQELRECYQRIMETSDHRNGGVQNHEVLTALRRAEGKPDPIRIEVVSLGKDLQGNNVEFPLIVPKVSNADAEREPCFLTRGADGGQFGRWQVHLTDKNGQRVPDACHDLQKLGGGLCTSGLRPFGDAGTYWLDAREYLQPPPSGRYTLELLHSEEDIGGEPNLAGTFVWKSAPVEVVVHNLQETARWSAIRVPVILGAVALATGLLVVIRSLQTGRWWFQRRDWLACYTIALLALAWSIDIFYMKHVIAQNISDRNAAWTMEIVEPGP